MSHTEEHTRPHAQQKPTYIQSATVSAMESSFVWMWGKALGNLEMRVRLLDAYLRQTGHPPVSNTILRDIIRHHEDPTAPKDGSRGRRTRKKGERPKKLIR